MDTTPFLTDTEFEAMFRPLSSQERELVKLLVKAAADWIRDPSRRPGLTSNDPLATQAKLVTFDVVKAALGPAGTDPRVKSYTSSVNDRTTTITYNEAAALLTFEENHLAMLGLTLSAEPRATFDSFDTAFAEVDLYGRRVW